MLPLAFLAILTQGLVTIPPSQWKAVSIEVPTADSFLECSFVVRQGGSGVQALVVDRRNADRFHRGRSFEPLQASGYAREGRLRVSIPQPGEYVLLLDNRLEGRSAARVDVTIDISNPRAVSYRTLSVERRRAVVALSLLFFGSVLAYSGYQFRRHAGG